jgi:hypothetical protein
MTGKSASTLTATRAGPAIRTGSPQRSGATAGAPAELLDLQRRVGNRATRRLMQHLHMAAAPDALQDVEEVLRLQSLVGNQAVARTLTAIHTGRRDPRITSVDSERAGAAADVASSAGQPLDPATRAFMESRFASDFGSVRVHTDATAAASADALDARAYTIGHTIVFATGEFAPATVEGRRLLAHELAHVVQQRRAGHGVSGDEAHSERRADAAEQSILTGARVPDPGAAPVRLARKPKREHGKVIDREEALRLLLPLASFSAAQDSSQGALNVIREVLLGPRTEENAAQRWLKLEAACSLLTPDDAAAVRRALTQPATPAQKQLRGAFHALTHVVQGAVLKVLDARISAPAPPEPPSLSVLPDSVDELVASIKRLPATYPDQEVATWVAKSLREFDWQRTDVQQPVLAALAEVRPRAFRAVAQWLAAGEKKLRDAAEAKKAQEREQFERDLELSKRSPGLVHMAFGPAHTRHTYRDLSWQIRNPALRFQSRAGTSAAFQAGHNQLVQVGVAAGVINLLYATAIVAPLAAEAAPLVAGAAARGGAALASAGSTVVRVVGNELALAGGALRWAGQSALNFYLHNPILVNEIGLFTAGLILSVEGDVPGLLKACAEDPLQAGQIFLEIWTIRGSVRTPRGQNYDVTLEVQPLPPTSQQGNSLKFRALSATTTPVPEPGPPPKPPIGYQVGGSPTQTTTQTPPVKRQIGFRPPGTEAPPAPEPAPDVYTPSRPVAGFARPLAPAPEPVPATGPPVVTEMPRAQVVRGDQPTYGRVTPSMTGERRDAPARASATKPPPSGGGEAEGETAGPQPKTPAAPSESVPAAAASRPAFRRFPDGKRAPDIAVIEVGADGSVNIVTANREDMKDRKIARGDPKAQKGTHIELANDPDGLGPITEGARRYRAYLAGGTVYSVEPLSRAAQDRGVIGAIGRALRRHKLVAPNGTRINLSPDKPDETLKDTIL